MDPCPLCSKIHEIIHNVLYSDFFSVELEGEADGLPLQGDIYFLQMMKKRYQTYGKRFIFRKGICKKSDVYFGKHIATKLG